MKSNRYLIFSAMGIELVGLMVGALYLGQSLDARFQTKGLAMIALSILCLAGWLFQIVVMAKKVDRSE